MPVLSLLKSRGRRRSCLIGTSTVVKLFNDNCVAHCIVVVVPNSMHVCKHVLPDTTCLIRNSQKGVHILMYVHDMIYMMLAASRTSP